MWKTILRYPVKATILSALLFHSTNIHSQPDLSYQPFIGASEGLVAPIELVSAPGDPPNRLFIVEKGGTIRIWNGSNLLADPFLDISSLVLDDGEQGLLSMAFHPQYQSNGHFFVYYNNNNGDIIVERYQVSADPDIADPAASPVISIPKNFDNHNGGHLQFRVEGGTNYLYFATGDGGSGNDPDNNAQDPASLLGKMLRINVDVTPFTTELWAMGLRNPFRWSFDRNTGDIWIGDVGQSSKEEINFRAGGTGGANYGWACVEGFENNASAPAGADCDAVRAVDVLPVMDYDNPDEGRSVVGGYVYRGSEFPGLQGSYIATDFYSGNVWIIQPNGGGWAITERPGFPAGIASISEAADGTLYAVSLTAGIVYKLVIPIVTPLNLVSFSGSPVNGYNELTWITESEENIDKYVVQFSPDGTNYSDAGQVVSGNYQGRHEYRFNHNSSNMATVYYRLQIREAGGEMNYSPVISIGSGGTSVARIYPTSITDGQVHIISPQPVERIVIMNTNGAQVFTKLMNGATGYFSLGLPGLHKGFYFISVTGRDFRKTEKLHIR